MSFELDLRRSIKNFEKDAEKAVRKVAIKAYSDIIRATPVDTGRARGNWNISGETVDTSTDESATSQGIGAKEAIEMSKLPPLAVKAVKNGDDINIANNLPYIRRLEHGYSKQAPQGMVRKTVQRLSSTL